MNFAEFITHSQKRIETKLSSVLAAEDVEPKRLHLAMRYATLGGGKRVRPMLVYATGEALGLDASVLDLQAAAIEIIHAFSLIHDDLPAMDDDDLRRGKPTVHIAYDEATAILAADAMQPLAFEILATDPALNEQNHTRAELVSILAKACGSRGMTGGQAFDLEAEGKQLSQAEIELMYRLKTGRLLSASVLMPAACSTELNDADRRRLARFSESIGLAFQIRDDILDIEGETQTIGKQQGADIDRAKATWPALLGLEPAKQRTDQLLEEALAELKPFGSRAGVLAELATYIVTRET